MANIPWYAPNAAKPAPRQPQSGDFLFELQRQRDSRLLRVRTPAPPPGGVEALFFTNRMPLQGRGFDRANRLRGWLRKSGRRSAPTSPRG